MDIYHISRGERVILGNVAVSSFLREVIAKSKKNTRWSGTLRELELLTLDHMNDYTPGVGSTDDDVRLVHVPAEGFYTTIAEITDENRDKLIVRFDSRVAGEAPVPKLHIVTDELFPAKFVQIVIYRADLLAKDDDRSSDAEWEIVAILANPYENTPMHPTTMARNSLNLEGGTQRNYTPKEWAEAEIFWQRHAYTISSADA